MRPLLPVHLLQKYTAGTATPQEMAEVEAWYAASEAEGSPLDLMSAEEKETLATSIRSRIAVPSAPTVPIRLTVIRPLPRLARIAATVVLVLLAGLGAITYRADEQQLMYANSQKVPLRLTLSDSSVVWLHPGASLTLAPDFGNTTRSLILQGVAFFQVTRDENRPFLVHTKEVFTQVLGTSFTVDATPENHRVDVVVLSGSVRVQQAKSAEYVVLRPTQKARYLPRQHILNVSVSPKNDMSSVWKAETIEFDNTPLRTITQVLSRRFGVPIEVESPGAYGCELTARFTGQHLPAMLEMISKSLELTYELNQNKVLLKGRGCRL